MNITNIREQFSRLSSPEQIALVKQQVSDLETEAAAAWLQWNDLPSDPRSVNRLAFSRFLAVTNRLGEDAL